LGKKIKNRSCRDELGLAVVVLVDFINLSWAWHYGQVNPRAAAGENFEAGTVSLI